MVELKEVIRALARSARWADGNDAAIVQEWLDDQDTKPDKAKPAK